VWFRMKAVAECVCDNLVAHDSLMPSMSKAKDTSGTTHGFEDGEIWHGPWRQTEVDTGGLVCGLTSIRPHKHGNRFEDRARNCGLTAPSPRLAIDRTGPQFVYAVNYGRFKSRVGMTRRAGSAVRPPTPESVSPRNRRRTSLV